MTNDKYIMVQYTIGIGSTPSQNQLLSYLAQWLEHSLYNRGVASSSISIGILIVSTLLEPEVPMSGSNNVLLYDEKSITDEK